MTREDIDRIASEYFNDKESEHEMDEVFDLAKKALEERKEDVLDKIRSEIEALTKTYPFVNHIDSYVKEEDVRKIIDKYKVKSEEV